MTEVPAAKADPGAKAEPSAAEQDSTISIKVTGGDNEFVFKLKRTTPLRKVMEAYCQRVGKSQGDVRFQFDGNRIAPDATPEALEMENDDCIDAYIEQHGGRRN